MRKVFTPEDVVFYTDSEKKSVILIKDNEMYYASEGRYGGYILKEIIDIDDDTIAYLVIPEIHAKSFDNLDANAKKIIEETLDNLPDEIRALFDIKNSSTSIEEITYEYVQAKPIVKKKTERYIVIDLEPIPNAKRLHAKAIRISKRFIGSRRYPEGKTAKEILKEIKIKYPNIEILQKMSTKDFERGGRDSELILKLVIEAPKELLKTRIEDDVNLEELMREWGLSPQEENKNRTAVKEPKETPRPTTNTKEKEKVELSKEELEELERLVMNTILRKGLQPVKIIVFTLPTEYLRTKTKYQKDEDNNKIYEIKEFSFDPATFRTLRRKFYDALHEIAWKSEIGWIAFHDADLSVIDKYIAELNRLVKERGIEDTRYIEVIDAYLPRDFLEKQLTLYIRERKASYQSILEKLNEEKLKAREVKRLRNELLEIEQELKKLEKELKYLRSF